MQQESRRRRRRRRRAPSVVAWVVGAATLQCAVLAYVHSREKRADPVSEAEQTESSSSFEEARCAFVTLLIARESATGYSAFCESATRLREAFALEREYAHLALHEGTLDERHRVAIAANVPWAEFVNISSVWGDAAVVDREALDRSLGYSHMCRFYAVQIFRVLRSYAIIMRVDDDVFVLNRVPYDPFRLVWQRRGTVYAYGVTNREEHLATAETFRPWLAERCEARRDAFCRETARDVVDRMYFNNIFVARVEWWNSAPVRAFLADVDASDGIYRYRWGDAPVQTAALKFLVAGPANVSRRVARLPALHYVHFSTDNLAVDGDLGCLSCDAGRAYFRAALRRNDALLVADLATRFRVHRPAFEADVRRIFANDAAAKDLDNYALERLPTLAFARVADLLTVWCDGAGRVANLELLPRFCCCRLAPFVGDKDLPDLRARVRAVLRAYAVLSRDKRRREACPRVARVCALLRDRCENALATDPLFAADKYDCRRQPRKQQNPAGAGGDPPDASPRAIARPRGKHAAAAAASVATGSPPSDRAPETTWISTSAPREF
ncbi:hypothetical protein CTAYLR_010390 [Chrysophaeum taylorii]|uniref:Uncharacterized protein n=1 Tax=Chrysophaeum taylorii TaxID=2483200 RepID=A0AAD7UN04_9STRA|nr:hypothetical protein CTAYLR_010390 [Chrysophaeum taylorii]